MENPLLKSAVNVNITQGIRENIDQEVSRMYDENVQKYELNSVRKKK